MGENTARRVLTGGVHLRACPAARSEIGGGVRGTHERGMPAQVRPPRNSWETERGMPLPLRHHTSPSTNKGCRHRERRPRLEPNRKRGMRRWREESARRRLFTPPLLLLLCLGGAAVVDRWWWWCCCCSRHRRGRSKTSAARAARRGRHPFIHAERLSTCAAMFALANEDSAVCSSFPFVCCAFLKLRACSHRLSSASHRLQRNR